MSMMPSLRRLGYITKVILCLLIIALIIGTTGCAVGSSGAVRYDLTVDSTEGGSVDVPGEGTFICDAGRVVDMKAIPTSGYRFVNWTGDVDTINNPNAASTTITMDGDYSITANFEQTAATYYTLTIAVSGSGSTSPDVGQHSYAAGTAVTISASPASGYYFSHWTAAAGSFTNASSATTTFTMPAQNVTVTASFEESPPIPSDEYSLAISSSSGGSVSTPG